MIWFRKFAAIYLLSIGAALVFLPLPGHLAGERTQEAVRLEVRSAPFTEESARARFGGSFIELSYEGMAEFPEVREAILGLMDESGSRCVPSGEWQALLVDRSIADPVGMVYAFRDSLYRISSIETKDFGPEGELVCFEVTMLGAYDNLKWSPMSRIETGDLDGYPELKVELERLAAGPIPADVRGAISPRQWLRFQRHELDGRNFIVFDRLFLGTVEDDVVPWSLQTPWLGKTGRVIGAAAIFLGILMGFASYRTNSARPGIPISSPWFTVFCDVISLIGGSIFAVLAIDTLWVGPIGQSSLVGLYPEWPSTYPITGIHFISVPVFLVVLPLLTLWFTSLSAQRIQVDGERVTSHGAFGPMSIRWQDLKHVRLRKQRNPFSFSVTDFRILQKVLELEGKELSITINEPGSRKRKRDILDVLRRYAPETQKSLFKVMENDW